VLLVELQEPYRPRPVRDLGTFEHEGWRLKRYGIAYAGDAPRPELVEASDAVARATLPLPAQAEGRYGVGFLGIHDGRGHCFTFVDWWADENELHHRVFITPADAPGDLRPASASEPVACVWDLAVMAFERDAWVRCVLDADAPDVSAYLVARLQGEI